jgi:hypothetical protein
MYALYREFYCRYLCYLNTVSSLQTSILCLCSLFEELFQQTENRLFTHLVSIGVEPLRIGFPMLYYAFIGYLEPDQIFLLFDRIIGFRGLEILAILAIGIFKNRHKQIFAAKEAKEVEVLF